MQQRKPQSRSAPQVVISASIAYDIIMSFGGSIADHIIPDKTHVISVSFLVDSMRKLRGGVGGNIAYSLALLGTPASLVGSVGADFGPYREALLDLGVDLSAVVENAAMLTASAFMMADQAGNQIASFYPGPSAMSMEIPVTALGENAAYAIVGATDPEVMKRHAREFGAATCRMIYDPAFQIIILSGEELREGIDAAWALIGNDYEFAMIERKTGLTVDQLAATVPLVVVTYGEQGSELRSGGEQVRVPSAPTRNLKEPTGAGDAYRAGMTKGLLLSKELAVVGRIAGLAAVHAVEHHGPQEHFYTAAEFVARFDESYPDYAGAVTIAELSAAD